MPKTVLIYSGGMDSTTLLYWLRAHGHEVICIGIDYGQRHVKELKAAQRICADLGLEYRIVDLSALRPFLKGSSQTDDSVPVPHGHYAEESMKKTVVPNRNMIMLSIAGAVAIAEKADYVAYGPHAGDHAVYPDCRQEFTAEMDAALQLADWHKVKLLTPFVDITKAQIARRGHELGVPFELTWSCYEGGEVHCGVCGTDVERKEAFELAGVLDPTEYAV